MKKDSAVLKWLCRVFPRLTALLKKKPKLWEFISGIFSWEFILYALVGVGTSGINFGVFYLCDSVLGLHYAVANAIGWFLAVTFAYVTNKFVVFRARNTTRAAFFAEIATFYAVRLTSLGIEEGGMFLLVDVLGMNKLIAKGILLVIVIIFNYVFGKLVIFKKKPAKSEKTEESKSE